MQKPKSYEETKASGDFTPVELGGHHLIIKQVSETTTKTTGKPMIVVLFDFDDSATQAGYFTKAFKDDIHPERKWPFSGTKWIVTEDADGNCSKNFKTFTTSVEHSNPGFETSWGDNFGQQFKNKKIGGVFGEAHYLSNKNEDKVGRELRWFCASDKADSAKIPDPLPLNEHDQEVADKATDHRSDAASETGSDGFMNIPDGIDEELPFN